MELTLPEPDGPPTITRWPEAPTPVEVGGFLLVGLLTFGWPGIFTLFPIETNVRWLLGIIFCVGLVGTGVWAHSTRKKYRLALAAYNERKARLEARWARVKAAKCGDPLYNSMADGGPIVGIEMLLVLEFLGENDGRWAPLASDPVDVQADFETHVAQALVPGALLEVAYDPIEHTIIAQRLFSISGICFNELKQP